MVGAVVQRENASFARMRSGVQFPSAPPPLIITDVVSFLNQKMLKQ
jgi:hypothetical protein